MNEKVVLANGAVEVRTLKCTHTHTHTHKIQCLVKNPKQNSYVPLQLSSAPASYLIIHIVPDLSTIEVLWMGLAYGSYFLLK